MKKLTIFGLALMLVFGMTMTTMAVSGSEATGDFTQNSVTQDIGVSIDVDEYAELDITNGSDIDLTDIQSPGESRTANINYDLLANTSVQVTPSVTSNGFGDVLELEIANSGINSSPTYNGENSLASKQYDYGTFSGKVTGESFGVKVKLNETANSSDVWQNVEAGNYSATVTLTVSDYTPGS